MYLYLFYFTFSYFSLFSKHEKEAHFDKPPFTPSSANQLSQISAEIWLKQTNDPEIYFVFPYFISLPTKKDFLKCVLPMICVSHTAQNKLTPTQGGDLSAQVKAASCIFCSQVRQPLQKTSHWCAFQLTCLPLQTSLVSATWTGQCPLPATEGSNTANMEGYGKKKDDSSHLSIPITKE